MIIYNILMFNLKFKFKFVEVVFVEAKRKDICVNLVASEYK